MKYLIEIDKAIFYFINITIQNPFFDWLMPFVTKLGNFKIPIITGSFLFFILGKKKERLFLILLIATILFAFVRNLKQVLKRPSRPLSKDQ